MREHGELPGLVIAELARSVPRPNFPHDFIERVPARAADRGRDLRPQHMPFVLPFGGHDGVDGRHSRSHFRKNQSCGLEGSSVEKGWIVSPPLRCGLTAYKTLNRCERLGVLPLCPLLLLDIEPQSFFDDRGATIHAPLLLDPVDLL